MKQHILFFVFIGIVQLVSGQAAPPKPCSSVSLNGGFEAPLISSSWSSPDASTVPGWNTTASDNKIEIWNGAFMNVPAYAGAQFAELNANMVSHLYQEICTPCPAQVNWSFAHRGRLGTDVCVLKAGPPNGPYTTLTTASDGNTAWGVYSGTYAIPVGQTVTRLLFESVSASGGSATYGNFLDSVVFTYSGINISISQINVSCGMSQGSATASVTGGSAPYSYVWSPTGGNAASATGLSPGTYSVLATDALGCSSSAFVVISAVPSTLLSSISGTHVSCSGMSNGTAVVASAGGNPPYSYTWSTSPPQISSTVSGLAPGTYSCLVTDAAGCSNLQTINITQPPPLTLSISATPSSCGAADGTALAIASGGVQPVSYFWLTNPAQTSSSIGNLAAGVYNVIITDANSCTLTQSVTVSGGSPPVADFNFSSDQGEIYNTVVEFTDQSSQNSSYWYWYFGDGDSSSVQNPVHQYPEGNYCITLVVADASQSCFDTIVKCFEFDLFSFYVPNTFTPNGDGINDLWMPYGIGIDEQYYKMMIFDRWGNLIFETAEWGEGWDGRANRGKDIAQQDVYIWKIQVRPENERRGGEKEYMGHVNLVK